MLHGIKEINIAGGRLFLICYCLKMVKRCHMLGANPLKCCSEYQLQFWTGKICLYSVLPHPQSGLSGHARLSLLTSPTLLAAMYQQKGHRSPWLRPLMTAAWHHSWWPHSGWSKFWGSLSAAVGGSGRLVWVIFCLGFFVSSSSSVSLSQTWTTTLGVDSVPAWSSYFSPGPNLETAQSRS